MAILGLFWGTLVVKRLRLTPNFTWWYCNMSPRGPLNFMFLGTLYLAILPKFVQKMMIWDYFFRFKVKYDPLRDLRFPSNFTRK